MILGRLLDAPDNKFTIKVDNYSNGEHLLSADIEDDTRKEYYDGAIVDHYSFTGHVYPEWTDNKDGFSIMAMIRERNARLDYRCYPLKRTEKTYAGQCDIYFNRNKVTKFRLIKEGAPWIYL